MNEIRVVITYCPKCNWLLRSAWMGQELLSTFAETIDELALRPSQVAGDFRIEVGETVVWDRRIDGGFPDVKQLKQRVRDIIQPEQNLGHLDRPG